MIQRTLTIRLYRILWRQTYLLPKQAILLHEPLDPRQSGRTRLLDTITQATEQQILNAFAVWKQDDDSILDWLESLDIEPEPEDDSCWTNTEQIRKAIRYAFRKSHKDAHNVAIQAYTALTEQQSMIHCTSSNTESQIRVTATSRCIGRSLGESGRVKTRFAYRIRIENLGQDHVQLLGRTWYIQETENGKDHGKAVRVHAPQTGAVGQLPVLRPGQAFEYMSGCDLTTTVGYMKGCFHLAHVPEGTESASVGQKVTAFQSDARFEVGVSQFPLIADLFPFQV